jgi:serine/threonine protein kinase
MITFKCGACAKKLSVTQSLAGRKVQCPACGHVGAIPLASENPAAGGTAGPDRVAPAPDVPAQTAAGGPTSPPIGNAEATQELAPRARDDSRFTQFLAPPQADDELGRLGKYRILKILGHGGMGVVFKAEDPKLERTVAIKAMLPNIAASASAGLRFMREARTMARVEHDHIVRIYQVDEDRGVPFMAMEFLRGESLDQRLRREPIVPVSDVVRIGREIADALAAAHATGLIHRDIKPANIWLESKDEGGRMKDEKHNPPDSSIILHPSSFQKTKILDFGLARAVSEEHAVTQEGMIVGTPAYMAPEQGRGEAVDARCDLFSLGVVLYRMSTGKAPFQGSDTVSTLWSVGTYDPPPPAQVSPSVPAALSDLIMRLLVKDPAHRIGSAAAVVKALENIARGEGANLAGTDATVALDVPAPPQDLFSFTDQTLPVMPEARLAPPRRSWSVWGALAVAAGVLMLATTVMVFWLTHIGDAQNEQAGDAKGLPPAKSVDALPGKFRNDLGMEFVLVPRGKSWLGGGKGVPGDKEVVFTNDFFLGAYEVTQEEWESVAKTNPSFFSRHGGGKEQIRDIPDADLKKFPVEHVSWNDIQIFLAKLNARVNEPGWIYRLPTEAEWEYACRGGPLKDRFDSAQSFYLQLPSGKLVPGQANFKHANGLKRTSRVGTYGPNSLGLYDMHGNVWEWCSDADPDDRGVLLRVNRGGSWEYKAGDVDAASRWVQAGSDRDSGTGLRLARVPLQNKMPPGVEKGIVDFVEIHDADEARFDAWLLERRKDNYRPVSLTIQTVNDMPRYTSVAVKEVKNQTWEITRVPRSDDLHIDEMMEKGFGIVAMNLYGNKGETRECYVWLHNLPASSGGIWVGTLDFVEKKIALARQKNLALASRSGLATEDGVVFSVTIDDVVGVAWMDEVSQTLPECRKFVDAQKARGWRIKQLYVHGVGAATRFGAIAMEDPDKTAWEVSWSLTPAQYEAELKERKGRGFRPHSPVAHDGRFSVIWIRYKNPGDERRADR